MAAESARTAAPSRPPRAPRGHRRKKNVLGQNALRIEEKKQHRSTLVDKSVLALPELRRIRDREHVRYVTHQSCLICGRRPSDADHLCFAQNRALSRKVSDEFTVPLCRGHHREVHRSGDEAAWWKRAGIDPSITARALWLETHPLPANTHRWPEKGPLPPR
jgi:hypothetical protein